MAQKNLGRMQMAGGSVRLSEFAAQAAGRKDVLLYGPVPLSKRGDNVSLPEPQDISPAPQ